MVDHYTPQATNAEISLPFNKFITSLYGHRDGLPFARSLLSELHRLIPSDYNSWKEIVFSPQPKVAAVFSPRNPDAAALLPALQRHVKDHPVLRHWQKSGFYHVASRWSDVTNRPTVERLPLYDEFYRPLGVRHQMMVSLETSPSQLIYVALNRSRTPFTDEERALLTAIQPHASHTLRHIRELNRWRTTIASFSTFIDTLSQGVVCLSPNFKVRWASKRARHYLRNHLGWTPNTIHLPKVLQQWLTASQQPAGKMPRTLSIRSEAGSLMARVLKDQQTLYLLLEEISDQHTFDALKTFGLTNREAEVLGWITCGKSNEQIAAILGIGPQTVKKHLEHVYSVLGVTNRTEAALKAQAALNAPV